MKIVGFCYERVLLESDLWKTFSINGEIGLESQVVGNSARKRIGTYCLEKAMGTNVARKHHAFRGDANAFFRLRFDAWKMKFVDWKHRFR